MLPTFRGKEIDLEVPTHRIFDTDDDLDVLQIVHLVSPPSTSIALKRNACPRILAVDFQRAVDLKTLLRHL